LIVNVMNWRVGRLAPLQPWEFLRVWQHWDAARYISIADHGYRPEVESDVAFFPLYPMLVRAANFVLPQGTLTAALVVANVFAFLALLMLHRLTNHELGEEVADRTVFYLVAFPLAFFLVAPYNHSLFVFLAVASLYAMRRGNWWIAGALGGLATGTRSAGIVLVLVFAYEYLRQHGCGWKRPQALAILLVPTGLIAFCLFTWRYFGDPLAFSHVQQIWHKQTDWPWMSIWYTMQEMLKYPTVLDQHVIINAVDLAAVLGVLLLLVLGLVGPWKLRPDQRYILLYGFGIILIPLLVPARPFDTPMVSVARYVLDAAPLFMMLGIFGRSKAFDRLYLLPAIAMQALLLAIFMHDEWVG
jgi:Gpi18-like mannosyltransferase